MKITDKCCSCGQPIRGGSVKTIEFAIEGCGRALRPCKLGMGDVLISHCPFYEDGHNGAKDMCNLYIILNPKSLLGERPKKCKVQRIIVEEGE
jgi:hypothetical protein